MSDKVDSANKIMNDIRSIHQDDSAILTLFPFAPR